MSDDKVSHTPEEQRSTDFVPADDWTTQWANYFRSVLGRTTEEELRQLKKARDDRNEEANCARCEKQRDYLLMYSRGT